MVRARLLIASTVALLVVGCGGGRSADDASRGRAETDGSDAPAVVRTATFASIVRLTPAVDVEREDARTSIELEAARGEREAGQLVAWAERGSPRVVLRTDRLVRDGGGVIPADAVTPYVEHAMKVERGSPAGRRGTYVDPLVPAAGLPVVLGRTKRLLAWVDVAVPTDARPGTYRGSVSVVRADADGAPLDASDASLARVGITLRVRGARIPDVPTLGSHVGADASQMVRFEDVQAGSAELRAVTERYAALLADARLSIGDVGVIPPGTLRGHRSAPGDEAALRRMFGGRGVASVRIPFYMDHPFADPLGRDRPRAVAYLRAAARWARANGWGERMYVFAIDEPDVSRAGEVRELHELVHEADPRLPLLVTTTAAAREFRGVVDIWAPNVSQRSFRPGDVVRERRAGRPTWWYPSITTWQPYPTLFIDELRPTPRALGWLAWRNDVRGILYWSATHWHEVDDPYRDPATYREPDAVGNGDGVLVYPGGPIGRPGRPVPSIRLLQLRDGIEDHDLLVAARCAASPGQLRRIRAAVRRVAPAMDEVTTDAEDVAELRTLLFAVIGSRTPSPRCIAAPRG